MHEANYMTIIMHKQNNPASLINIPEICRQQLNYTLKPEPSTPFSSSLTPHPLIPSTKSPNPIKKSPCVTMGELSWLLTVYELAFLLFRVKEAAQVEDDGQKEHEAGHGDDRHRLLTGDGTIEVLTPESAGHVHLQTKVPNIRQT